MYRNVTVLRRFCTLAALFVVGALALHADEITNHFRSFPVPPDEARILALNGVREFCCRYEVMSTVTLAQQNRPGSENKYQQDLMFFAEVYSGTTCTARYRLSNSVNVFDALDRPLTGTLSLGWNEKEHELISVIKNDQFYSPWTARVHLPDFDPCDAHFFENARPEKRHSTYGGNFEIYPVLGICGDRRLKIPGGYEGIDDAAKLLGLYRFVNARNVVIIYAYPTEGGDPPLPFASDSTFIWFVSSPWRWFGPALVLGTVLMLSLFVIPTLYVRRKNVPSKS